jgi:hypothetical protein
MPGSNADIAKRVEQLAVAQAVYKLAAEQVKTNEPGNLRAEVDAHFRELFEQAGAKSFDIRIGGEKVGTYSVKVTKPKMQTVCDCYDQSAYLAWCEEHGFVRKVIDEDAASAYFEETGELPFGCNVSEVETPGGQYAGGSLRVDVPAINRALGGKVPIALLGGGEL